MSEVKRYRAPVLHHDTGWMKSYGWQVVMASDYDAAQSELAALREELAKAKARSDQEIDSADEETSALREIIRDLKDWRECSQSLAAFASILERAESVIPAPGPLRKALTAAEQRNADTIAKLELAASMMDDDERGNRFAEVCRIAIASLKPTESGATEGDEQDGKTAFVRSNTKQGQNISMADMKARYEDKP